MKKLKINITKKEVLTLLVQVLFISIGTFIMSFGYCAFLQPYNIVPGGFMGLAQIIADSLAKIGFTAITTSVWYIILNVFLFIYAVVVLGWKFGIRAGVGIGTYSLFVALFEKMSIVTTITNQFEIESATMGSGGIYILFAIFGGLIMGAGIGLVFRADGSTGGCDMVAVVVNRFFPSVTTGQLVIAVDAIVVVLSAITYKSIVLPLFALITIYVYGKVSDMFVDGVRSLRAFYILTNKKEEVAAEIMDKLQRGVTAIPCEGMYTKEDKDMLLVVLRRSQIVALKNIIKGVDPQAFTFNHIVKEAYGQGFYSYSIPKLKLKPLIKTNKTKLKKAETVSDLPQVHLEQPPVSSETLTSTEQVSENTTKKDID